MKSNIFMSLVVVAFISGCGSSDSTPISAATTAAETVVATVSEAATSKEYDVSGTETGTNNGLNSIGERKISADGAFVATSNTRGDGSVNVGYTLADNANELVITQVTTTEIGSFEDVNGKGTYTQTTDLAKGTTHMVGTNDKEGDFDCVQTYDVGSMPKTINSTENVYQFIYLDGFQKLNTTCPAWIENMVEGPGSNESVLISKFTDNTGRVSTIKQYEKYTLVKATVQETVTAAATSKEYDVTGTSTFTDNGINFTSERKISADGAFTTTSNTGGDGSISVGYTLADNANELVMTQVTTTDIGSFDDASGKGTVSITSDLAKGTSHIVGTNDKEGNFDCIQTFDVGTMPKTINSTNGFDQYIYMDGFQQISTTCPTWIENQSNGSAGISEFVTTVTVTDNTGRVSTIKQYEKIGVIN